MEQPQKNFDPYHRQKVQRIEALSDGVFAITMTLLILEVRLPVGELIHSEKDMWAAMLQLLPKIVTYMMTFLVAGFCWGVYANQYNYIHKADKNLFVLSVFYLMFVSMLPFSAAQLSEHLDLKVSAGLYGLNIFIIFNLLLLHWAYAHKYGLTNEENKLLPVIHKAIMKRGIIWTVVYIASLIICFFNSYISIALIFAIQTILAFNGFFAKGLKAKNMEVV